jgi:hypothetical protein
MNNEPVAWMVIDVDNGKSLQFEENKFSEVNIPLYTHPVKELTMTDDEVMDLWNEQSSHPAEFARAILRKAQEK